jgi:ammonia channel protein AmtB
VAGIYLVIGAVGGLILWFGWYGFNPGSTLSELDTAGIGRVSFNTTLAACSAGLTALFYSYFRSKNKTWDLGLTVNGFLGGLVAITCPCYWVDPVGAFFIGVVAAIVVVWGLDALAGVGLLSNGQSGNGHHNGHKSGTVLPTTTEVLTSTNQAEEVNT